MIDTATLIAKTDLLALVGHDTTLRRVATTGGGEYAGPCPFCRGRDRFRVQPNADGGGRWLCRHCTDGKWQNVIGYVMRRESCDFRQACEKLGAADTLPARPRATVPTPKPTEPPHQRWQAAARQVIETCERNLWADLGKPARLRLAGRGLRDDTLRLWHLGYMPGGPAEWRMVGLLSVPCGIVIPCEVGGAIWYVKTRRETGEPKYIMVKGSVPALFGADTLRGQSVGVLCEGEFDAMLLHQEAGDLAGVATLGSASASLDLSAWGDYLLPVARLLVAYDLDKAGKTGADKLAGLTARARRVSVPAMPNVKDLTDFWKVGGKLRDWLAFELARFDLPTAPLAEPQDPEVAALAILDAWADDPQPNHADHARRYAAAAIAAGLPCYDPATFQDLGAWGWDCWAADIAGEQSAGVGGSGATAEV
jgi:DNA primase